MNDPCDRCDGEGKDCVNCPHVRKWLEEQLGPEQGEERSINMSKSVDKREAIQKTCKTCEGLGYTQPPHSNPCPDCTPKADSDERN
jgi:DnaJ-class molecular chaperone